MLYLGLATWTQEGGIKMADRKEYVKLWLSYADYFKSYSDVEVGRLVRAMITYRASG